MTDLKKPDLMTPEVIIKGLANICGNLTPVHIPPRNYSSGMIPNFFKRIKAKQIRLIMEEVQLIEQSRTGTLRTQLDQAKFLTFYSDEIHTNQVQQETSRIIMKAQAEKEVALAEQEKMKVSIMYFESKKAELEVKKMVKEYKEDYGAPKAEDRNE